MPNYINPNSAIPMYKQVLNIIKNRIDSGELKPGDKLPPETTLLKEFDVSRITIRSAIMELVEDGTLIRSQGKGTFVAEKKAVYQVNDKVGFTSSCHLIGKVPVTKVLSAEKIYPTQKDMSFFEISETEMIICTKRLRSVDGNPVLIEENHYPPSFSFLLDENLEGSLFELLQTKHHITIINALRSVEICYPTKEEIKLLNLKTSTPLLLFRDDQRTPSGEPVFISKQLYNTERMKFYF